MPNRLKEGTMRVSYVESQKNDKAIALLAGLKSVTKSSLIREAVVKLLDLEDADGSVRATAKLIIETQSDNADKRIQTQLNDEVIERLKMIALR